MDHVHLRCGIIRATGASVAAVPKQYLPFGKPFCCNLGVHAIVSGRATVEYVTCTNYVHGLQREAAGGIVHGRSDLSLLHITPL